MINRLVFIFLLVGYLINLRAQTLPPVNLQIIAEEPESNETDSFQKLVEQEIQSLLGSRYNITTEAKSCDCSPENIQTYITEAFADSTADILIVIGPMASAILAKQDTFPKPSIAGVIIDPELQNVPLTAEFSSGVNNFTYLKSPFSFEKDLKILHQIYPYKNIGIISPVTVADIFPNFQQLFGEVTNELGAQLEQIIVANDAASTLNKIPDDIDAVYLLPFFDDMNENEQGKLMEGLIEKGLPSVSFFGESMVSKGALIGYESAANLARMPRRIALNILKILEGENAANLPVTMDSYSESTIINMSTARKLGTYPEWDLMNESVLLDLNKPLTDRTLNLETVVVDALANNLSVKFAEFDPQISEKDVTLAKAELLPQLDASSTLYYIDKISSENSFGNQGRLNWIVNGQLSQLVYSEPALANIAIQKLLQEGAVYGLETTQLDVIQQVVQAYLIILQAQSFVSIQNQNVTVTKQNFDIARVKEAVGYSGASDLNRWKSELALNKIDLNDAQAQFRQARYQLNALLNQDIDADFLTEDIGLESQLLYVTDQRMFGAIKNEGELDALADFLVAEAMANLPELKQVDVNLSAQERLLLSQERKNYLPSFAISGGLDYFIQRWERTPAFGMPLPDSKPTWNLGLGLQYPIFQGGKREQNIQRTRLSVMQIQAQQADLRNQLELRVRAALEVASASYYRVQRFEEAAEAALKNFSIVQDSYSQGVVSITSLIDAQNAAVNTSLGRVNAVYQFINDFFQLERSTGFYYMLRSEPERDAFFERLNAFMSNYNGN